MRTLLLSTVGLTLGLAFLNGATGCVASSTNPSGNTPALDASSPPPDGGGSPSPDDGGAPPSDAETLVNGIPGDPPAATMPTTVLNNLRPAAQFAPPLSPGLPVRVTLLGLLDPVTGQPIVYKANESVFLSEDGVVKGLKVTQSDRSNQLPVDLVFVVDNSGSMGEEADGIAEKIVAFASLVRTSGVDIRLGVVGYNGRANGGINLGDAAAIETYLKRLNDGGPAGTSRTVGFGGADATDLQTKATAMAAVDGGVPTSENGIVGIVFAEQAFTWRANSQRIFVNFTDEPTQPGSRTAFMTKTLCARWTPESGTIHTVWSGPNSIDPPPDPDAGAPDGGDAGLPPRTWTEGTQENPADLSRCTPGGVAVTIKNDASDLDLTRLPMTSALRASALVEFNSRDPGAAHDVVLVVKNGTTSDGKAEFKALRY